MRSDLRSAFTLALSAFNSSMVLGILNFGGDGSSLSDISFVSRPLKALNASLSLSSLADFRLSVCKHDKIKLIAAVERGDIAVSAAASKIDGRARSRMRDIDCARREFCLDTA
jgi:hypothetical protein